MSFSSRVMNQLEYPTLVSVVMGAKVTLLIPGITNIHKRGIDLLTSGFVCEQVLLSLRTFSDFPELTSEPPTSL